MSLESIFQVESNDINFVQYNGDIIAQIFGQENLEKRVHLIHRNGESRNVLSLVHNRLLKRFLHHKHQLVLATACPK